jgi:hypothetical protein
MTGHMSSDQARVVFHGSGRTWTPVELPTGPEPIPDWALDLHVEDMDYESRPNLATPPRVRIKAARDLRTWQGRRFQVHGDLYLAESPDGIAEAFYQGGGLSPTKLRRYRTRDGALHTHPPLLPRATVTEPMRDQPGEWVEVERMATRQEQGFAGWNVDITLEDGTEATLRGPWHGGPPPGYVEAAYVDATKLGDYAWMRGQPWHQLGGVVVFVRLDVFAAIFARFAPHMRLAAVSYGTATMVEAYDERWGAPRAWVVDEYLRRRRAQ